MKKNMDKETLDAMHKDLNNWKGPVYFNRNDYRLLVQKRYPALGWTFNFANPYVYLVLGVFILLIMAAKYLF